MYRFYYTDALHMIDFRDRLITLVCYTSGKEIKVGDHKNDEEEGEVEGVGWLALEIKHFFDLSFALFFQ